MPSIWPARRIAGVIVALLLAVISVTWIALRANLWFGVRQVDRLLSEIKSLRVRESTFQDAKQIAGRYGGMVEYHGEPCSAETCSFAIWLGLGWEEPRLVRERLRFFGIRTYRAAGSVTVRHGRVVETGFMIDTEAKLGTSEGQWLAATTIVSDRIQRSDYYSGYQRGLDEHPNRQVIHPFFTTLGGGQIIDSEITADATEREKTRAFDFRLSCIFSLKGCSQLRELAPSAWEDLQIQARENERLGDPGGYGTCPARSLARIARDIDNVALVEVEKVFPVEDAETHSQDVKFRLIEMLKGQIDKHLSRFPMQIDISDDPAHRRSSLPPDMFSTGNRLVLFLKEGEVDFVPYPHCEVVSGSEENLALIRQTISEQADGVPITALAGKSR
jgi:hypothetical protein